MNQSNDVIVYVDGIENRPANVRVRQGGVTEILKALANHGFFSGGSSHVIRMDDQLLVTLCFNVGPHDAVKAMEFSIDLPFTDSEKKLAQKGSQIEEDNPAVAVDVIPEL